MHCKKIKWLASEGSPLHLPPPPILLSTGVGLGVRSRGGSQWLPSQRQGWWTVWEPVSTFWRQSRETLWATRSRPRPEGSACVLDSMTFWRPPLNFAGTGEVFSLCLMLPTHCHEGPSSNTHLLDILNLILLMKRWHNLIGPDQTFTGPYFHGNWTKFHGWWQDMGHPFPPPSILPPKTYWLFCLHRRHNSSHQPHF